MILSLLVLSREYWNVLYRQYIGVTCLQSLLRTSKFRNSGLVEFSDRTPGRGELFEFEFAIELRPSSKGEGGVRVRV